MIIPLTDLGFTKGTARTTEKAGLMIVWCAYCQQFLGEKPAYDDFLITHGVCTNCAANDLGVMDAQHLKAERLAEIHRRLFEAGEREDLKEAEAIIDLAVENKIRPVDVLLGFVTPLLYEIGSGWEKGEISIAQEHRFTSVCETVLRKIKTRFFDSSKFTGERSPADVLLVNAPGNRHTLALEILNLWLTSKGVTSRMIKDPINRNQLVARINETRPKALFISIALAHQFPSLVEMVEWVVKAIPRDRPKIIIGGYAVKIGSIPAITGAQLIADVSELNLSGLVESC